MVVAEANSPHRVRDSFLRNRFRAPDDRVLNMHQIPPDTVRYACEIQRPTKLGWMKHYVSSSISTFVMSCATSNGFSTNSSTPRDIAKSR